MKGALNYERMDRFTGMAIVSYAWDDGIRSVGKHMSRIFYGRLAREAQLCGTSDYPMLPLYKAEVQQLL